VIIQGDEIALDDHKNNVTTQLGGKELGYGDYI
jgi:hypothetical protein